MTRKLSIFYLFLVIATTESLRLNGACRRQPVQDTVAVLLSTEAPAFDQVLEGFRDYFEQKNIPVDIDVLHDGLAAEAQNVKLIFALGSEALVPARVAENPRSSHRRGDDSQKRRSRVPAQNHRCLPGIPGG